MKIPLLLFFLLLCFGLVAASQEICNNGVDDDNDGEIDLLDKDCACTAYPLIKNPSFEKISQCPSSYSQLHYAVNWLQPSPGAAGSTDLYHKCGECSYKYNTYVSNIPMPVPDGEGFAGFFDIKQWYDNGAYKEYATSCLDAGLRKDSLYVLEFYLGFINPIVLPPTTHSIYSFSPVNVSLFGHPSCTGLPYGKGTDTTFKSCPLSANPQWVELAKLTITSPPGQWVKVRAEFKAPKNIESVVIGPSCEKSIHGGATDWGFYLLDQVLLYKKEIYDLPSITRSGDVCLDTLTLTANFNQQAASIGYQWYKNDIALPGEISSSIKVTRSNYGDGYYRVRVTANQKTWLSPEAIVKIDDVDFTIEDTVAFCNNGTVLLNPVIEQVNTNCPISYLWQDGSVGTSLTVSAPGTYWFQTERNGCRKRDSVVVIAYTAPVVDLGKDTSLCPGETLLLSAANPGLQYQWQDNSTAETLLIKNAGTYNVKVSNSYCTGSDTIIVKYDRLPEIVFSADTILCEDEQKHLTPQVYGDLFQWNTGSSKPDIIVTQPGIYILQAQNKCGITTEEVNIVPSNCKFFMPTAFTPNNDGLNDSFGLLNYGFIRKFECKVYSRWGTTVFATTNPAAHWNGTSNGKNAPPGVYVWTVKYTDWRGREYLEKGTVALIR